MYMTQTPFEFSPLKNDEDQDMSTTEKFIEMNEDLKDKDIDNKINKTDFSWYFL